MTFATLVYHEIRKKGDFNPEKPSPIDVKQSYEDLLPPPLFVTLEHFEEQMEFLHKNEYHTLTLNEVKDYYYNDKPIPEKSILLTFDDCFQSVKEYAYPILKKYGFKAVSFVVTGWLKDNSSDFNPTKSICMSKEEISEMTDVFELANHTDSFHQRENPTTSMMMVKSDDDFSRDLDKCNEFVEIKDVFAFPFGLFEDRNVELLQKKRFKLAFTTENGQNNKMTDPLRLKRNVIPYFLELEAFQKIVG